MWAYKCQMIPRELFQASRLTLREGRWPRDWVGVWWFWQRRRPERRRMTAWTFRLGWRGWRRRHDHLSEGPGPSGDPPRGDPCPEAWSDPLGSRECCPHQSQSRSPAGWGRPPCRPAELPPSKSPRSFLWNILPIQDKVIELHFSQLYKTNFFCFHFSKENILPDKRR